MTENDYIAEYIKEKHPALLGFDFAMWKFGRRLAESLIEFSKGLEGIFNSICEEEYKDE